jgi:hypothetical protein
VKKREYIGNALEKIVNLEGARKWFHKKIIKSGIRVQIG